MFEVVLWILAVFLVLALVPLVAAVLVGRAERKRAAASRATPRGRTEAVIVALAVLA